METNLAQSAPTNPVSLPLNEVLPALSNKTLFWRPKFLAEDQGLSHLPFLFWLVDSCRPKTTVQLGFGNGSSYFALCQAVDKLDISARCFAIEPGINIDNRYNKLQYQEFSQIKDLPYEQASQFFSDATVDLLHVNLAVDHTGIATLISQWLPKLSDNAVVLLQNSQANNSDSWRLIVNQLRTQYPVFEFLQDNGLLLIVPAKIISEGLARLLSFAPLSETYELVQTVFSRLGKACSEGVRADLAEAQVAKVSLLLNEKDAAIEVSQSKITGLLSALNEQKCWLSERDQQLETLQDQLQQSSELSRVRQAQAQERVKLLEQIRIELKAEIDQLFAHVDTLKKHQFDEQKNTETLQHKVTQLSADNSHLQQALAEKSAEVEALTVTLGAKAQQFTELQQDLSAAHATLSKLNSELAGVKQQLLQLKTSDTTEALQQQNNMLSLELKQQAAANQQKVAELIAEQEMVMQLLVSAECERNQHLDNANQEKAHAACCLKQLTSVQAERNLQSKKLAEMADKLAELSRLARFSVLRPVQLVKARFQRLNGQKVLANKRADILASGFFDENYYRQQYPDVADANTDVLLHYIRFGGYEGRNPSQRFDSAYYLNAYADVRASGVNPLWHYIKFGKHEKRKVLPAK